MGCQGLIWIYEDQDEIATSFGHSAFVDMSRLQLFNVLNTLRTAFLLTIVHEPLSLGGIRHVL